MNQKIAFIGTGNMGGALLRAACQAVAPAQISITDKDSAKAKTLAAELGCVAVDSNLAAVRDADYVVLGIKPQMAAAVLQEVAPALEGQVICSILAGVTISTIQSLIGKPNHPVVRIMPNTPILIGKGLLLLTCGEQVTQTVREDVLRMIAPCGESVWLEERLFDQGTVLSGCVPAFVYMFIEALADGGVATGLSRAQAVEFAARAVSGAAAMVLETGMHPGALKDMVTSPGGSTIAGVLALEENGFRHAAISAVQDAYVRTAALGEIGSK